MDITDTGLTGSANHYDRKVGAWCASLHCLTRDEINMIGLWEVGELDKHYLKYSGPNTCAKLSGFASGSEFYIKRAELSPEHFLKTVEGTDPAFFSEFMGFLDDPGLCKRVNDILRRGVQANRNVFMALKHLRSVFYQDIPFYFQHNPDLRMFQCQIFKTHQSTFQKWCEYCTSVQPHSTTIDGSIDEPIEGESPLSLCRLTYRFTALFYLNSALNSVCFASCVPQILDIC